MKNGFWRHLRRSKTPPWVGGIATTAQPERLRLELFGFVSRSVIGGKKLFTNEDFGIVP